MTFGIGYEQSSGGAEDRLNDAANLAARGHTGKAATDLRALRRTSNTEFADSHNTAIAFRAMTDYHLGAIGIEEAARLALTTQNNTPRDEVFWHLFRDADKRLEGAAAQAKGLADDRYLGDPRYQSDFNHLRGLEAWLRGLRGEGMVVRAAFGPPEDIKALLGKAGVSLAEAVNLADEAGDHVAYVLNAMRTARLARIMKRPIGEYRRAARRRVLRALPTKQGLRCLNVYARIAPSLRTYETAITAVKERGVLGDKPPTHHAKHFRRAEGGPR